MLTAGAIVFLILFVVNFIDFATNPCWRRAWPMLISLAVFAGFFGAQVAIYGQ